MGYPSSGALQLLRYFSLPKTASHAPRSRGRNIIRAELQPHPSSHTQQITCSQLQKFVRQCEPVRLPNAVSPSLFCRSPPPVASLSRDSARSLQDRFWRPPDHPSCTSLLCANSSPRTAFRPLPFPGPSTPQSPFLIHLIHSIHPNISLPPLRLASPTPSSPSSSSLLVI